MCVEHLCVPYSGQGTCMHEEDKEEKKIKFCTLTFLRFEKDQQTFWDSFYNW